MTRALLLIALAGCTTPVDFDEELQNIYNAGVTNGEEALNEDIAALITRVEALEASLTAANAKIASLEENSLTSTDLDGYATESWVEGKAYATEQSVTDAGYATEDWVSEKDYATIASVSAAGYATQTWVGDQAFAAASALTTAQTSITTLQTTTGDHATRIADLESASTDYGLRLDDVEGVLPDGSTLLVDAGDCDSLRGYLENDTLVATGESVTVQVPAGYYDCGDPIYVSHPAGGNLIIEGEGSSSTEIEFAGDGFVAKDGHSIGLIKELAISGDGTQGAALYATRGGSIAVGVGVEISSFGAGAYAELGGSVDLSPESDPSAAIDISDVSVGIWATLGGSVRAWYATISAENGEQIGALATHGGVVDVSASTITDVAMGLHSSHGGVIAGEFVSVEGGPPAGGGPPPSDSRGLYATMGGVIDARDAITFNFVDWHILSEHGSTIDAELASVNCIPGPIGIGKASTARKNGYLHHDDGAINGNCSTNHNNSSALNLDDDYASMVKP